jgi:hypothetical protein
MPSPDQALRHLPKHQLDETELVNLHVGSWIEVLPIALGKADTPRAAAVLVVCSDLSRPPNGSL